MAKSYQHPGQRGIATGFGILAITAVLFGCAPSNQQPTQSTAPTAQPTAASPTAPDPAATAAGTASSGTASSSASSPARGGRPTIKALRAGLFAYFRDDQDLAVDKAQTAADCAAYPSYQELSPTSLNQLAKQNPAGMTAADLKVFKDVVTECVTSANGNQS